ncbi:hypothetical protein GF358_00790 [Candidatus Woesearchaeota archaeon]|nr:hypothetical protein [Candidatus Woesearchaeota archaeon]
MKKAQITVDTLIALAILAVALIIIGVLIYPAVKEVLVGAGEKGACEWSLVMHSISKLGDFSLVPPECKAHRMEITMDDLEKYHFKAKQRIKEYEDNTDKYSEILKYFDDPEDPNQLNEWALNLLVAAEMKDCWEKVFKGKLPLFDKWWLMYSWDMFGIDIPKIIGRTEPVDTDSALAVWVNLLSPGVPGTFKVHGPPVNCIICSRIKFSEEVKNFFGNREIRSLDAWIRFNYPLTGGESYYEVIVEGQSPVKNVFEPRYGAYDVQTPLAVLYERIYAEQEFIKFLHYSWEWIDQHIALEPMEHKDMSKVFQLDYVEVVPYTQEAIIDPIKGEGCTFVLD